MTRRLRDLEHLRRRAEMHELEVKPTTYGMSIPCPTGCGNEVIFKYDPLVGVAITSEFCLGCNATMGQIAETLLQLPASGTTSAHEGGQELRLKPLREIRRREPVMIAPGWKFPLGTVCILAGQQGIGKGTIISKLAADLSHDHGVIFLSEEDSAEATIKPRIQAAGGNVDRVFLVEAVRDAGMGGVLLPRDNQQLGELAASAHVRLIAIDPWTNHLATMDLDKGTVRTALMPLKYLADEHNLVVLLSAHPVKNAGRGDPLSEIAHASAVSQVARAAYWVMLDPDYGPDQKANPYRLCAHIKNNMTSRGDTLRYQLKAAFLPAGDAEPEMNTVAAHPDGMSELDYWSIRKLEQTSTPNPSTELARCCDWLQQFLTEGHQERGVVIAAGEATGYTLRTIERAREQLGVLSRRGQVGSPSVWSLPARQPLPPSKNVGGSGGSGGTVEKTGIEAIPTRASRHSRQPGGTRRDVGGTVNGDVAHLISDIDQARAQGVLPDLDDKSWADIVEAVDRDESPSSIEMLQAILGHAR